MPEPQQSSWADEIEEGDISSLPAASEKMVSDTEKILTTWSFNDEGKKVKTVRTYRIEKKIVSKAVARRKNLPKFGMSKNDRPGPNPQTTVVAEEIFMQFVAGKDEADREPEEKSALDLIKEKSKGVVKCRICKEDHWTTNCPYKDTLGPLRDSLVGKEEGEGADGPEGAAAGGPPPAAPGGGPPAAGGGGGKYVPPSRRGGEEGSTARQRIGESMPDRRRSKFKKFIIARNITLECPNFLFSHKFIHV